MMDCYQLENAPSCQDSLRAIESDIQHANKLPKLRSLDEWVFVSFYLFTAASISRAKGGACLQMKLVYNHLAPVHTDSKQKYPSHGRKATIGQFYAVILPSLEHLYDTSLELDTYQNELHGHDTIARKKPEDNNKHLDVDMEREDECGICLDRCTKMVLPNCCHAMCINCYSDWNTRSESCPFCRGSLKRVKSGDLWVLTHSGDVVDQETLSKEDMLRFYLYINNLPKDTPDALFLVYYEYLI
ncbi:E3 ubiquitin-protein ligase AIRP2 [Sesamum angolense]|uniref:E3 ubiquitin-protein ligase AIRP2 n=1 Tax=Sesamum angolense TaxID=2727404 RepID=A0AAE1XFH7_9LAMI|nr:E3 ubiquitin-protein ligase AIRP2 [Sesamum angolense]